MTALLAHAGFLYSASYDGAVKMWDADTMELVQDVKRAHEGGRVNCATVGADGNLYTGGDDKVRPPAWHACVHPHVSPMRHSHACTSVHAETHLELLYGVGCCESCF